MLVARNLTKRYPGVTALDSVDFTVNAAEVVGLIGENGAGKSTLIKVLGGLTKPDTGEIELDGNHVTLRSASDATRNGIALIHQELNNLDNLDVGGNVFLGREPKKLGFLVDTSEINRRSSHFLEKVGLRLPPSTPLRALSIAQQQLVEIAKALSMEARLIVMDEPTSCLTATETETLLAIVKELQASGVAVVYVSHRLKEVQKIADRVIGLRDGRNAGELSRNDVDHESMVRLMVGRDLKSTRANNAPCGNPRLVVDEVTTDRYPDRPISFHVCAGEIVGVAGLVGAGRSELVRAIYGADQRLRGTVRVDGELLPPGSPKAAIRAGLYLAPEDRRKEGVVTTLCIRENVALPSLDELSRLGLVKSSSERATSRTMIDRLKIKAPDGESNVRDLSGGNQQKVVLAKWLAKSPACLIFDEPTRGIDVGARAEIYEIMKSLASEGVAILMVSSDLEEVLDISDRILVMHEGKIKGELTRESASEEAIMQLAVGNA